LAWDGAVMMPLQGVNILEDERNRIALFDLSTVEFYPRFSTCFGFVSFNFGVTETPKLAVSL
jgi:hypothetical protein